MFQVREMFVLMFLVSVLVDYNNLGENLSLDAKVVSFLKGIDLLLGHG